MAPSRSRPGAILLVVTLIAQVWRLDAATGTGVITAVSPTSITVSTGTTITLTGSVGAGDLLDFLATCGAAPSTSVTIGPPNTATVTVGSTGTGLKLCYRANGQADSIEQTGITLNVIAATPNNKITSISPTSIYASTNQDITLIGNADAGDKVIFAQSCAGATPNVSPTVGTNKVTQFNIATTGTNFRLCYRVSGGSDSVAQDNIFLSISAVGGVGADPVTWYEGKVRVFSLPVNTMMPLLHATDMELHGATFMHGGPWQQWFGRLVLASPDGDRWVEVAIRKDILEFNRSRAPKGLFETIDVTLGHGRFDEPSMRTVVPGPDVHIPLNFLGFDVVFWKMARNARAANTMIGTAHRECMEVAGANVHFYVCSSPAHEFYGWQRDMAVQHAHLDLAIIEVKNGDALKGTLPELWGMQPMSKETEAFIVKDDETKPESAESSVKQMAEMAAMSGEIPKEAPSKDVLIGLSLPALPEGSLPSGTGWAGGLGFKDLENSCKQGNQTVLGCEAHSKENQKELTL